MKIKTGKYRVELSEKSDYNKESISDKFEKYYFDGEDYQYSTQILVKVYENESLFASAIICGSDGASGIHGCSQIVDEDEIVICCSSQVFNLSIPNLKLNWSTKVDEATCFGVFQFNQDFIVHGEMTISRLSKGGKIIWQKNGLDIFTRLKSKKDDFKLTDQYIYTRDWGNRKYQFDFDGDVIKITK